MADTDEMGEPQGATLAITAHDGHVRLSIESDDGHGVETDLSPYEALAIAKSIVVVAFETMHKETTSAVDEAMTILGLDPDKQEGA